MKVAVFSARKFELPFITKIIGDKHELIIIEKELNSKTVELAKTCEAVALFTSDNANAETLEKLSQLGIKYIALRSVGFDHVDLKKAKELNVKVANVPSYSPYSVAEHALTLLMALNRKLMRSQELMKLNDFRLDELTGFDVHEKTIGIVGLGKIGEAFARIMNGFDCKLLCYDPKPNADLQKEIKIDFVSFNELCSASDIISIHCPLNTATKHLFNTNAFSLMKQGIYIINTARGPIIKTEDIFQELESGKIGGLGLDVYEFEKGMFFHDHTKDGIKDEQFKKLRTFDNVLITGHQAFLTETALKNIAETTLYNLTCFKTAKPCENELL